MILFLFNIEYRILSNYCSRINRSEVSNKQIFIFSSRFYFSRYFFILFFVTCNNYVDTETDNTILNLETHKYCIENFFNTSCMWLLNGSYSSEHRTYAKCILRFEDFQSHSTLNKPIYSKITTNVT